MADAAKHESSQEQVTPKSLKDIYSAIVSERKTGEKEDDIETPEDVASTRVTQQFQVSDNEGKQGSSEAEPSKAPAGESDLSAKLTALSLGKKVAPPSQRTKRERRLALAEQGKGRKERLKQAAFAAGKEWSEIDNEAHKKPQKKPKNVLTRMEVVAGPLSLLHRSVKERLRVKVWTRSYKHVRGICTGYILAFDTHFNMVMADVDEVYTPSHPTFSMPPKGTKKKRKKKSKKAAEEKTPNEDGDLQSVTPAALVMKKDQESSDAIPVTTQVDGTADSSHSEEDESEKSCGTAKVSISASDSSSTSTSDTVSEDVADDGEGIDLKEGTDLELMELQLSKLKDQLKDLEQSKTTKEATQAQKKDQVKTSLVAVASVEADSSISLVASAHQGVSEKVPKPSIEKRCHHGTQGSEVREEEPMDTDDCKRVYETDVVKHKKTKRLESVIGNLRVDVQKSKSKTSGNDLRTKLVALHEARTQDKKHASPTSEQHPESNRNKPDSDRHGEIDREIYSDRHQECDRKHHSTAQPESQRREILDECKESEHYSDKHWGASKQPSSEMDQDHWRHRDSDRPLIRDKELESDRHRGYERELESDRHRQYERESDRHRHYERGLESDRHRQYERELESDRYRGFERASETDRHWGYERALEFDRFRGPERGLEFDRHRRYERELEYESHREYERELKSDRHLEYKRELESDRQQGYERELESDRHWEPHKYRPSDRHKEHDRRQSSDREREPSKHRESDKDQHFEKVFDKDFVDNRDHQAADQERHVSDSVFTSDRQRHSCRNVKKESVRDRHCGKPKQSEAQHLSEKGLGKESEDVHYSESLRESERKLYYYVKSDNGRIGEVDKGGKSNTERRDLKTVSESNRHTESDRRQCSSKPYMSDGGDGGGGSKQRETNWRPSDRCTGSERHTDRDRASVQRTERRHHETDEAQRKLYSDAQHAAPKEDHLHKKGHYFKQTPSYGRGASSSRDERFMREGSMRQRDRCLVKDTSRCADGTLVAPPVGTHGALPDCTKARPSSVGSQEVSVLAALRGIPVGDTGLYRRHMKQVMIRGDNVVMVSLVP